MTATQDDRQSRVLALMETMESEIVALRCVTGLLNGQQPGSNAIQLSELSYILDPIVDRQAAVLETVREMFVGVGFDAER